MERNTYLPEVTVDDFCRRLAMRSKHMMWLLGAGSSASAGIPTAQDMIWQFKQLLFISQRRGSPDAVADLTNPTVRHRLQEYIDASAIWPHAGDPDEYAALFEATFPSERDRQHFIDAKVSGAKPSYGHMALAALMKAGQLRLVWTTNFDSLLEDACAKVFDGTSALTTATLDSPSLASSTLADERWPLEVKLHGDFRSRRLKNTSDELRTQDATLRRVFVDASVRFGLVVMGYSGRDQSIMQALERALDQSGAFPHGLFWLYRDDAPLLPGVRELIDKAVALGIEAAVVRISNFDEVMRDLIQVTNGVDLVAVSMFAQDRPRLSPAPRPTGRTRWPQIRLNALPVVQLPTSYRRVVCSIRQLNEAREAVSAAGVDVLVTRVGNALLAFGADPDVRAAFAPYSISDFDLQPVSLAYLRYESLENAIIRAALATALGRSCGLDVVHHRNTDDLTPRDPAASTWRPLKDLVGTIYGTVPHAPDLYWREGCRIRLAWANNQLWLLIDPRPVLYGRTRANSELAADFSRERTVKRYNRQLNDLIAFWANRLSCDGDEIRAFNCRVGVDATFRLGSELGFSWRVGA